MWRKATPDGQAHQRSRQQSGLALGVENQYGQLVEFIVAVPLIVHFAFDEAELNKQSVAKTMIKSEYTTEARSARSAPRSRPGTPLNTRVLVATPVPPALAYRNAECLEKGVGVLITTPSRKKVVGLPQREGYRPEAARRARARRPCRGFHTPMFWNSLQGGQEKMKLTAYFFRQNQNNKELASNASSLVIERSQRSRLKKIL